MTLFHTVLFIIVTTYIIIVMTYIIYAITVYHNYSTHYYRIALVDSDFQTLLSQNNHILNVDQIWSFCKDNDDIIDDINYEFDENNNTVYTLIYKQKLA